MITKYNDGGNIHLMKGVQKSMTNCKFILRTIFYLRALTSLKHVIYQGEPLKALGKTLKKLRAIIFVQGIYKGMHKVLLRDIKDNLN